MRLQARASAERVSAAAYGTVLILAALPLIHPDDVADGVAWELIAGVGLATWVAHLFAEVIGDHVRHTAAAHERGEILRSAIDGLPILVTAVPPALVLFLGRIDVLSSRSALWVALAVAVAQLVALGAYVGSLAGGRRADRWIYAGVTAVFGLAVVAAKLALGH